ncbi:hypothetical protein [Streptomyces poonensis]|uniref:Tetratricopeptide repeat protein n=1 Tax=Streptomyces poonensis TaxID=68255 RepID=A0A918PNR2_9ACTN|nr:hypothetical protein [Streptomyces poonensis]GGZ16022.1 hypothetical protein GCM10010365_39870 [Streptomyces poonensis]GLJ90912.1 hypothetical protein GCM10017589_35180 [Streptomyces poonensis]
MGHREHKREPQGAGHPHPEPGAQTAVLSHLHLLALASEADPGHRPAPVREFAVAETVVEGGEADGAAVLSPLAEPITRINEAIRAGRIAEAAELAETATDQAAPMFGEEHPGVLRLRELTAYIAYLAGDPLRSCRLSLALARLRHRLRDPLAAYGHVQSAAAAWRAVRDPLQGLRLGRELLGVWAEIAADEGPAADDIEQLQSAHARMGRLAERARALHGTP